MTQNFLLHISSSWVEIRLYAEFQLPRLPRSGSSMVGDKTKQLLVEIAEVGAGLRLRLTKKLLLILLIMTHV